MLLLGVLQAQAAGQVAAGSYDLLETQVLASSQASVTFSSLSSYAADYQHLQIRFVSRADADAGTSYFRFNGDTGSNYAAHRLIGNGSSVGTLATTSSTFGFSGANQQSAGTTGSFAASVFDILDFGSSAKNKTTRSLGGVPNGSIQISFYSGVWLNTAALTSVTLFPNLGNFVTGSRFSLYGIRGG